MKEAVVEGIETLGTSMRSGILGIGRYTLLLREIFYWTVHKPYRIRLLFKQLEFVGNKSFNIIFLSFISISIKNKQSFFSADL